MKRHQSVDDYIANANSWRAELERLREVLNTTALNEEIKWGAPCYTHKGKNVVGLAAFKGWALRQWRMTSAQDIKPATIKRLSLRQPG